MYVCIYIYIYIHISLSLSLFLIYIYIYIHTYIRAKATQRKNEQRLNDAFSSSAVVLIFTATARLQRAGRNRFGSVRFGYRFGSLSHRFGSVRFGNVWFGQQRGGAHLHGDPPAAERKVSTLREISTLRSRASGLRSSTQGIPSGPIQILRVNDRQTMLHDDEHDGARPAVSN